MLLCSPSIVSRSDGTSGSSVTVTRTWKPWARSPPAAPACSLEAGFSFLRVLLHLRDHRVGSWVRWSSPRPPGGRWWETGPAHPLRMVPMLSAPVLSHTGCCHRPPRQSRPAVRHTRPCSAPLSFLPPSPPGAVAPQPTVLRPDPLRCLHGAR